MFPHSNNFQFHPPRQIPAFDASSFRIVQDNRWQQITRSDSAYHDFSVAHDLSED